MLPISVLIATTPRLSFLKKNALKSVSLQTLKPALIVIISDKRSVSIEEFTELQNIVSGIPVIVAANHHAAGAAGCWNTGADIIKQHLSECYLAIIDDDDEWHSDHLSTCHNVSDRGSVDLVLSGINVINRGQVISENHPNNLTIADFLIGNPGWQGSNTFIRLSTFFEIGGYTNGLISCNDRDFAIRALERGPLSIRYTLRSTVRWHINHCANALSAVGSQQKLKGTAQFFKIHGHKMNPVQQEQFFHRMESLFKLERDKIRKAVQGL